MLSRWKWLGFSSDDDFSFRPWLIAHIRQIAITPNRHDGKGLHCFPAWCMSYIWCAWRPWTKQESTKKITWTKCTEEISRAFLIFVANEKRKLGIIWGKHTGWPFKLFPTSRWHQDKGCVLVHGPHTKTELLFWCQYMSAADLARYTQFRLMVPRFWQA